MPELPDLLYITTYLQKTVAGRNIREVIVKKPVVLRVATNTVFETSVTGCTIESVGTHGPFIRVGLRHSGPGGENLDLILNLMLAGALQHQKVNEKAMGHLCMSLLLDDASRLNLCDERLMAKAYLVYRGEYTRIPKYLEQGIDVRSPALMRARFLELAARHKRKQVRVFINDHTILSAIGNAYADEILFDAKIHPKTFTGALSPGQLATLHTSIRTVLQWGIQSVEKAARPIHEKVREHMKVRGRKGEPCPKCGTTIRREGVRGHDVFFCPSCQPATRKLFIDWRRK